MEDNMELPPGHKFHAGRTQVTQAAMALLQREGHTPAEFLGKHVSGDWGDHDPEQLEQNDESLKSGGPLHSIYHTSRGSELWVFTDPHRTQTTILLPSDQSED